MGDRRKVVSLSRPTYAMSFLGPNQTWQCGTLMFAFGVVRTSGWAREMFAAERMSAIDPKRTSCPWHETSDLLRIGH